MTYFLLSTADGIDDFPFCHLRLTLVLIIYFLLSFTDVGIDDILFANYHWCGYWWLIFCYLSLMWVWMTYSMISTANVCMTYNCLFCFLPLIRVLLLMTYFLLSTADVGIFPFCYLPIEVGIDDLIFAIYHWCGYRWLSFLPSTADVDINDLVVWYLPLMWVLMTYFLLSITDVGGYWWLAFCYLPLMWILMTFLLLSTTDVGIDEFLFEIFPADVGMDDLLFAIYHWWGYGWLTFCYLPLMWILMTFLLLSTTDVGIDEFLFWNLPLMWVLMTYFLLTTTDVGIGDLLICYLSLMWVWMTYLMISTADVCMTYCMTGHWCLYDLLYDIYRLEGVLMTYIVISIADVRCWCLNPDLTGRGCSTLSVLFVCLFVFCLFVCLFVFATFKRSSLSWNDFWTLFPILSAHYSGKKTYLPPSLGVESSSRSVQKWVWGWGKVVQPTLYHFFFKSQTFLLCSIIHPKKPLPQSRWKSDVSRVFMVKNKCCHFFGFLPFWRMWHHTLQ